MSIDVSIIIVSYESLAWLPECLDSLAAGTATLDYEVILVDNDSRDGTTEWARTRGREDHRLRILENQRNLGFARACNQGLESARGRYLLLLNPDTVVGDDAIARTVDYLSSEPRMAAASCRVVRPDGSLDRSCKREFPDLWDAFARFVGLSRLFPRSRLFARYDAQHLDDDTAQEVPLIDGCFMLIRREALEDIGPLDERFFMYAEEMDWCKRAHDRGWTIGYEPAGSTLHHKGVTTRRHVFRMLYHFHRSMGLYYAKHGRARLVGMLAVAPGLLLRFMMLCLLNLCRPERRVSD